METTCGAGKITGPVYLLDDTESGICCVCDKPAKYAANSEDDQHQHALCEECAADMTLR